MNPQEWNALLAPNVPWEICYPKVAEIARQELSRLSPDTRLTTRELVDRLYPENLACQTEEGMAARLRLLTRAFTKDALGSHQLADCMSLGAPKPHALFRGQIIVPCLWHRPETAEDW